MSSSIIQRFLMLSIAVTIAVASSDAAGDSVKVTIEGVKQGQFKADSSGKITATGFSLESESPRDAASGQASGKVQNRPVTITKPVDGASPQLFQALATNETLKTVTIEVYSGSTGGKDELVQTIRLTNAAVAGLRQHIDADTAEQAPAGLREDVSLAYQTIEFVDAASTSPQIRKVPAPVQREPVQREPARIDPPKRPTVPRLPVPRR